MHRILQVFVLILASTSCGIALGATPSIPSIPELAKTVEAESEKEMEQPYYRMVGEEIPPLCIQGRTYDMAKQLEPIKARINQVAYLLQYGWTILSDTLLTK